MIQDLFAHGRSFLVYPLRVVYCTVEGEEGCRIMVSVPKRLFKRAVKRNRLKRLMRESYRANQSLTEVCQKGKGVELRIAFGYVGKEIVDHARMEAAMKKALGKIVQQMEPADGKTDETEQS